MIQLIKSLLGLGPKVNFDELIQNGAQIIDVRTPGEFSHGHVRGAINIPLSDLPGKLSKIKKDKPVITCCASGSRSASAARILKSEGYTQVYNGGGWIKLKRYER